jgi:hypothetical protein
MQQHIATRSYGLARLQAFVPAMGRRYANGRNHDHGPGNHAAVSVLSPCIRRRLVTEQEVGQPFLRDPCGPLALGGDRCIGPRVEAAWTSGMAIADDVLDAAR